MNPFTVFVTVGTDHHPFGRLVSWSDSWAEAHPACTVVVQYGTAPAPRAATGHAVLSHTQMLDHMRAADVVVTQGGPAGIMDSRACGTLPIVVPRDPRLGEHVDDHQMRFAEHMARSGRIMVARDRREFDHLVDRAGSGVPDFRVDAHDSPTARTAALIDEALLALIPPPRRRLRRAGRPPMGDGIAPGQAAPR